VQEKGEPITTMSASKKYANLLRWKWEALRYRCFAKRSEWISEGQIQHQVSFAPVILLKISNCMAETVKVK
jgi:hypothetical protein